MSRSSRLNGDPLGSGNALLLLPLFADSPFRPGAAISLQIVIILERFCLYLIKILMVHCSFTIMVFLAQKLGEIIGVSYNIQHLGMFSYKKSDGFR